MKTRREHREENANEHEIATIRDRDSGSGWVETEHDRKTGTE